MSDSTESSFRPFLAKLAAIDHLCQDPLISSVVAKQGFSFFILFFFFFLKYIYFWFWLCWVFMAMCRLSLVAASRGYSLVAVSGRLTAVASPGAEHRC